MGPAGVQGGAPGDCAGLARGAGGARSSAGEIVARLAAISGGHAAAGPVEAGRLDEHAVSSSRPSTSSAAGSATQPKFPRPSELLFLLREHARTGDDRPAAMVLQTLRAMAMGGMRDHIGGGFHRYSVDGSWRVPHFEKMLYDQAQLVLAYLEGVAGRGRPVLRADCRGHAAVRRARDDRRSGRVLLGRGRRQRAARDGGRAGRTEDGRRLLPVDDRRGAAPAGRSERGLRAPLRPRAGRQRPIRSARRVLRQEHPLHRQVDCRHRAGAGDGAWRGSHATDPVARGAVQGARRAAAAASATTRC